ncbi:Cytochrome P450 4V2 [Hondaea fermentalgiana]|uniref:Cytochrome P450 4V2 n=1 Tax=Hondaea fermentalgiana TaxID=2315210 RepID=A0A2R5G9C8_9STRA|nr:Cytochrome P450 4V2 [Hondaea fermentalgiana]|eukprot:GBG27617.1 Cytochrome P450 4V2 [Hondaea fermentalgiana]
MSLVKVADWALALVAWADATGTNMELGLGVFRKQRKIVLDALTVLHAARLAMKGRIVRAVSLLVAIAKFSPRKGLPALTLFQYCWRRALWGKAGTELPPVVPTDMLVKAVHKYGPWKRHELEKAIAKEMGPIHTLIRPLSSTDYSLAIPVVWVSDPVAVKKVLTDKVTYNTRGHTGFTAHVGDGLLGLPTGPKWMLHRRVVMNFLSEKHLRDYAPIMQNQIAVLLDKWRKAGEEGRNINCYYDMSMLTLDIIMNVGTGEHNDLSSQQQLTEKENIFAHDLDYGLQDIVLRTAMPIMDYMHDPKIDEIKGRMDATFDRAVEIAKEKKIPNSMLDALLTAKNEDGSLALTEKEANEEFKTIRGAGHETTSNTICFMLKLLQENPDKLEKLRKEVDEVVSGNTTSYEEARTLKYAYQVMFETLRMYPTVPSFPREASCDTELCGYKVPKGAFVFVSQFPMNRSPEIWDSPNEFRPERFDDLPDLHPTKPIGVPGNDDLKYAFLPFGAGSRTCAGARLAMIEGVMVLSSIVKNIDFKVAMDPREELYIQSDVTMGPKHGLPLRVRAR